MNLMKYIFANYCNPNLNTGTLARVFCYATGALTKYLKGKTGKGVKRFIDDLRIRRAMALLVETEMTVEAVAISVGCECPRTFYRVFSAFAGITPKEYREKNRKNP